jgi:hypothetical protein
MPACCDILSSDDDEHRAFEHDVQRLLDMYCRGGDWRSFLALLPHYSSDHCRDFAAGLERADVLIRLLQERPLDALECANADLRYSPQPFTRWSSSWLHGQGPRGYLRLSIWMPSMRLPRRSFTKTFAWT